METENINTKELSSGSSAEDSDDESYQSVGSGSGSGSDIDVSKTKTQSEMSDEESQSPQWQSKSTLSLNSEDGDDLVDLVPETPESVPEPPKSDVQSGGNDTDIVDASESVCSSPSPGKSKTDSNMDLQPTGTTINRSYLVNQNQPSPLVGNNRTSNPSKTLFASEPEQFTKSTAGSSQRYLGIPHVLQEDTKSKDFGLKQSSNLTTSTPLLFSNRQQTNHFMEDLDVSQIPRQSYAKDRVDKDRSSTRNSSAESECQDDEELLGAVGGVGVITVDSDIDLNSDEDDEACSDDSYSPVMVEKISKNKEAMPTTSKQMPDVDEIAERLSKQHIGKKKPLIQFLNTPPPLSGASEGKGVRVGAINDQIQGGRHEDYKTDVFKAAKKLAAIIDEMPLPEDDTTDFTLPKALRVVLYPHQLYGVKWLLWRESLYPGGGILADEMGLGKTIMALTLILKGKESSNEDRENWFVPEAKKLVPSRATLVVCPVACMLQWETELRTKAKGLRVEVYHGPNRTNSSASLARTDVVITSYNTVGSEIPKPDEDPHNNCRSPLFRINWERIILDEGHVIRNPKTHGALSLCRLTARHRWIVTGTPVHNKPEDFFSLVKFLKLEPFDALDVWKHWIGLKQVLARNMDRLHTISKALVLRRTKEEVSKMNTELAGIPEKVVEDILLDLSSNEAAVYNHLEEYAKQQFKRFLSAREDKAAAMQNAANNFVANARKKKQKDGQEFQFATFFALLIRLRQASVLPYLMRLMIEDQEEEEESFEYNPLEDPINAKNPVFEPGYRSSKLKAVLNYMLELKSRAEEEGVTMDKAIIVSQWTSLLDIVGQHLRKKGFTFCSITGKDSKEERRATMEVFNKNPKKPQVLLLSMAAGGVGLNLVGANHVLFMEPHWNPQMELQAQDRVHRFGQTKPVHVKRFISADTIETRVIDLQNVKLTLANGVMNSVKTGKGAGLTIGDLKRLFDV